MVIYILKLSPASAGLCIVDLRPRKAHSGLRCKIALHIEENEQTPDLSLNRILLQYCAWMNLLHPEFVLSSRNHEQTWPSLSGHRPCELAPWPIVRPGGLSALSSRPKGSRQVAMPQYPQIVLFSCLLCYGFWIKRSRFRFSFNPEP